jgi:hypothetical protein
MTVVQKPIIPILSELEFPEHTTLNGCTEVLGSYCPGRMIGEVVFSVPTTMILAELEIRFSQVKSLHSISVWINPERYRS